MSDLSAEFQALANYKPTQKVRFVTAASLFDGHDAAINIMRRILQGMGAEVIFHGDAFDAVRLHCEALAREHGYRYIHSGDEPLLIAGVATETLEMLEEAALPASIAGKASAPGRDTSTARPRP